MNGVQLVSYNQLGNLFLPDQKTPSSTAKVCQHCHAVKWKEEAPGMCCSNGKVKVELFRDHPEVFKALWEGASDNAKTFLKYTKKLNDALSLTCLQVKRPEPLSGWQPTVKIQGKVCILMDNLKPTEGKSAHFAQLYVLDPDHAEHEEELRLENMLMTIPAGMSRGDRIRVLQLLKLLQGELRQCNSYVQDCQFACEILGRNHGRTVKLFLDETKRPHGEHARRFNAGFKEISVLMDDEKHGDRWLAITDRGGGMREILDTHRSADPLRFTLLFPTGQDGWTLGLPKNCDDPNSGGPKLTAREFYAFHLQMRYNTEKSFSDSLFRGRRLFQEYVCIAQAKVENQRLKYIKMNQEKLRGEKYCRLAEDVHMHQNDDPPLRSGKQIILPPSFTGGPRYMHAHFQDGMAIVRDGHKPDIFFTATMNSKCPELLNALLPGQSPEDRPDLISRVFNLKVKQMLKEINEDGVLGKRGGELHTKEDQKRGLPHLHMLLILLEEFRLHTADDVDEVICAELPPDPKRLPADSSAEQIEQAERLQRLVLKNMIHSCSKICLENGKCKKGFPKAFCQATEWEENAYYPKYRRRSPQHGGRRITVGDKVITNAHVVPYNPYFLLRYESHINVEACVSPTAAKYLFKYVTKGPDRVMARVEYNEVDEFQNLRSIGANDACWRLFEFPITGNFPHVMELRVHLKNHDYVVFQEGEEAAVVENGPRKTELTEFYAYNKATPGTAEKYADFPKKFRWDQKNKRWLVRQRGKVIGRIHSIHPLSGDEFYLRMLLYHDHCKGATSFENMLQLSNGTLCETYKEVCLRLGLLQDDNEWHEVLNDAFTMKMPKACRILFHTILIYCHPADPGRLYDMHHHEWDRDFRTRYPDASDAQLEAMVLLHLEELLQDKGKTLSDFNLPALTNEGYEQVFELQSRDLEKNLPKLMREELDFCFDDEIQNLDWNLRFMINRDQRKVFDHVMTAVEKNEGEKCIFVDARAGTGKTFTLNTILSALRTMNDQKNIALAVASSGIAAMLLELGRTFHSRFKAPLKVDENSTLAIKPSDNLARLIRECKAIIWDEAPMAHKHLLEALDRTLQDILQSKEPFGGKVIVLTGDFRQTLPIIPHGSRAQIVNAAICRSHLWSKFKVFKLTENMRIQNNPELKGYDNWMLRVGNGEEPIQEEPDRIKIPDNLIFEINDDSYEDVEESKAAFIEEIFPDMEKRAREEPDAAWIEWISERAILCPKNFPADRINHQVFNKFPGSPSVLSSADSTAEVEDATRFPVEYLNSLTPPGLPPHNLFLKDRMILLLLRNISKSEDLMNGTRLSVVSKMQRLLHCKIATAGETQGRDVLIPRIEMGTNDGDFPFNWKRRQFPVRPAFAMTINKSQGQTLDTVGVWLEEPVFSHGQLYVSASRVRDPKNLKMAIKKSHSKMTRNVVYKEVFRK